MRIACLGGGAAGLYFAISMKLREASHDITVFERNRPDDTFGWGVVFSAETLQALAENDAPSRDEIEKNFAYWDDIAVVHNGVRTVSTGHGFCGIGRMKLLNILQARAEELGVKINYQTEINSTDGLSDYDLIVAADGLNSKARAQHAAVFQPDTQMGQCHFIWLGTHQKFDDAFTFIFEETEHGWVWAHVYQFDDDTATFIVECAPET
ncbi:MAG: bifunctional salicylyl-CoA 5-hydroxylase/oxidoreductase, partial [Kordiimonadaceae bacterium]|nr:bifunctional salicylyl-CoA 5-hydroxylase/oxidoreductase [Kordiimonadaceae bacterium]